MHVAYIHQHFSSRRGSWGTRSYEFSMRLIRAGHRVTLIKGMGSRTGVEHNSDQRIMETDINGIRVVSVAEPYDNTMGFVRRWIAFTRFARTAGEIVCRSNADLVFATSTPLTVGIPGMKSAKRLGVPFVFEVRDLWPELPIAMGIVRNPLVAWYLHRMERRIYQAATRIIALAPGIKEGICRTGYPEDRVALIPNASDLELFKPSGEPLDDPRFGSADEFRLVFTGAHGLANGLESVLDAVAEIKRRGEAGLRFVFIGEGAHKPALMARSKAEGLDPWISWVSSMPREELAEILPRMNVGMMILKNVPAFYFGTSPNKFFDYISCGLPVLNNYPGWLADMIRKNECGKVVSPDDAPAFADAAIWMRDHREDLVGMGQNSRRLAENDFARADLADQFVETLERIQEGYTR